MHMADHITTKTIRAEDIALWEIHNAPQEVVRGEWTGKPKMAGLEHNLIAKRLFRYLDSFVLQHNLGEVYTDGLNYVLDGKPGNIVTMRIPDLSFVATARVGAANHKGYYYLAPDLAIEVVSPSESKKDTSEKVADYLRFGTQQVWVIDPNTKKGIIHFADGSEEVYKETLPGGNILPSLEIPLGEIFGE
jgi:Uma2 family endonuclease